MAADSTTYPHAEYAPTSQALRNKIRALRHFASDKLGSTGGRIASGLHKLADTVDDAHGGDLVSGALRRAGNTAKRYPLASFAAAAGAALLFTRHPLLVGKLARKAVVPAAVAMAQHWVSKPTREAREAKAPQQTAVETNEDCISSTSDTRS